MCYYYFLSCSSYHKCWVSLICFCYPMGKSLCFYWISLFFFISPLLPLASLFLRFIYNKRTNGSFIYGIIEFGFFRCSLQTSTQYNHTLSPTVCRNSHIFFFFVFSSCSLILLLKFVVAAFLFDFKPHVIMPIDTIFESTHVQSSNHSYVPQKQTILHYLLGFLNRLINETEYRRDTWIVFQTHDSVFRFFSIVFFFQYHTRFRTYIQTQNTHNLVYNL